MLSDAGIAKQANLYQPIDSGALAKSDLLIPLNTLDDNGNPITAHALNLSNVRSSDFAVDSVFYDASGNLRAVSRYSGYERYYALNLGINNSYSDSNGSKTYIGTAAYRPNGSLAICADNYFTRGGANQKSQNYLVFQDGEVFQRDSLAYDEDPFPTVIALAEYSISPNARTVTFQIQGLKEKLKSLSQIDSDPLCARGFTFTNSPGPKKTNTVAITIPRGCAALVKAVWGK